LEVRLPLASPPVSPIALARFIAGWSQADLGSRAGVSRETVSAVERGAIPRLGTARAIAHALDIDITSAFPESEKDAPANGASLSESKAVAAASDVHPD